MIAALCFEPLPLYLARRADPTLARVPLVHAEEQRVLHANPVARRHGVTSGMRLDGARMRVEGLHVVSYSEPDLQHAWHSIVHDLHQHTPWLESSVRGRVFAVLDPAWASRVTVMTFSEFGRTSYANDGAGTDHGSAAPQFVFGANVRGGRYGQRPSLAGLGRWDRMAHHVDMRSYYTSILDGWLGGGAGDVFGGAYENLQLFARPPGQLDDGTTAPLPTVIGGLSAFVPVTPARLADTRESNAPLGPDGVLRVQVTGAPGIPSTGVTAVVANVTAVDPTAPTYFTAYPGGTALPPTSSINVGGPGRPVPNLVTVGVGLDGSIEVFNKFGREPGTCDLPAILMLDESHRQWQAEAEVGSHRAVTVMPIKQRELRQLVRNVLSAQVV